MENILQSKKLIYLIQRLTVMLDKLLNDQINAILHHPRFQQLEASWCALYYLAGQLALNNKSRVKLCVLNVSWVELSKDLTRSVDFDQSQLFFKVYNQEFGHPGGEPFGLLIGDYAVSHRLQQGKSTSDIVVLQAISKVAAASFAPFVLAADAALLGLDDFTGLSRVSDLNRTFQQAEYAQWKAFREDEDSRFVGMVLPRILMRLPYTDDREIVYPLHFIENTDLPKQRGFLWGNPVYCFAAVIIRAFAQSGWFADICSIKQNTSGGGLVTELPRQAFTTDRSKSTVKYATNVCVTDRQEKLLSDWGFISLCECKYTRSSAFYSCPSVQKPKQYDRKNAAHNTQLSSQLHYILCVSRFAHYLKVMARDKIGSFTHPQECEHYLQDWLRQYTTSTTDMSAELKAKYPLQEAKVKISEAMGKPGVFLATLYLSPHYQFDPVESYVQLTTEILRK